MAWRVALGLLSAAGAAALGAVMLGEYELTGLLPYAVGPLFGLVIGEVVVSIGGCRAPAIGFGAAALAFGGVVWAGWIDSSGGLAPIKPQVWVAAALAAGATGLRASGWSRRHRAVGPEH